MDASRVSSQQRTFGVLCNCALRAARRTPLRRLEGGHAGATQQYARLRRADAVDDWANVCRHGQAGGVLFLLS